MNEYEIAFSVGAGLTSLLLVACIFYGIGRRAWAWIDDSKIKKTSGLINWVMLKRGWKETDLSGGCFTYYKGKDYWDDFADKSDGIVIFIPILLVAALSPILSLLAFKVYPITLTIGTLVGIAFLARFARRNKKMFDAHVEDKDAHKPV